MRIHEYTSGHLAEFRDWPEREQHIHARHLHEWGGASLMSPEQHDRDHLSEEQRKMDSGEVPA